MPLRKELKSNWRQGDAHRCESPQKPRPNLSTSRIRIRISRKSIYRLLAFPVNQAMSIYFIGLRSLYGKELS